MNTSRLVIGALAGILLTGIGPVWARDLDDYDSSGSMSSSSGFSDTNFGSSSTFSNSSLSTSYSMPENTETFDQREIDQRQNSFNLLQAPTLSASGLTQDQLREVGEYYGRPGGLPISFTPGSAVAYGLGQGLDTTPNAQVAALGYTFDANANRFVRTPDVSNLDVYVVPNDPNNTRVAFVEGYGKISVGVNQFGVGVNPEILDTGNSGWSGAVPVLQRAVDAILNSHTVNGGTGLSTADLVSQAGTLRVQDVNRAELTTVGNYFGQNLDRLPATFAPGSAFAYDIGQGVNTTPTDRVSQLGYTYDPTQNVFKRQP